MVVDSTALRISCRMLHLASAIVIDGGAFVINECGNASSVDRRWAFPLARLCTCEARYLRGSQVSRFSLLLQDCSLQHLSSCEVFHLQSFLVHAE